MKHILALILFFVVSVANADSFYVANNGKVEAYLLGSQADYENLFTINFEDVSSTPVTKPAWLSNRENLGTSFDFGTHVAGAQMVFVDRVVDTNNWWYSHTPFNDDGVKHFIYTPIFLQDHTPAIIGRWEDLYGGGDKDFNDSVLLITNVVSAVPEPSALWMVLAGLMILPMVTKRK